ncbi:hypothetical protein J6590_021434 [Homalodisca vitripennis]|nr:hypothetical protein J6590_021434 [Homalodisca vitripennis]
MVVCGLQQWDQRGYSLKLPEVACEQQARAHCYPKVLEVRDLWKPGCQILWKSKIPKAPLVRVLTFWSFKRLILSRKPRALKNWEVSAVVRSYMLSGGNHRDRWYILVNAKLSSGRVRETPMEFYKYLKLTRPMRQKTSETVGDTVLKFALISLGGYDIAVINYHFVGLLGNPQPTTSPQTQHRARRRGPPCSITPYVMLMLYYA